MCPPWLTLTLALILTRCDTTHHTGKVVALEANKSLVDTASKMARESRLTVPYPSGGARSVAREVSLDGEANPERITFKQCDPMCLPAGLAGEEVGASGGWVGEAMM